MLRRMPMNKPPPRVPKAPLRLLADALRQRAAGVLSRAARRRLLRLLRQRSRARADVAER
jgi:hypothetical protein